MMSSQHWLDILALAGVPAFVCRRTGSGVEMSARTPEFTGLMQAVTGVLDERNVLSRLTSAWPAVGQDSPFVVCADDGPAPWRCVVRPFGDMSADHLAIFRLDDESLAGHDAYFTMIENLPDIVTRHDDQLRFLYVNPAFEYGTGFGAEHTLGKGYLDLGVPEELAASLSGVLERVLRTGEALDTEFDYAGPHGLRHYLARVVPERDDDGRVLAVLCIVRDISDLKRVQHQLELLARTDPLTSLLNRRSFLEHVGAGLDRVRRGQGELSLLLLDVDDFKDINDRLGHAAGDRVLEAIARVLVEETRADDVAARLGGDEFCIALVDADAAQADAVARRIRQRITEIGRDAGRHVGVSIGVATADPGDDDPTCLVARVDELMYRAKDRNAVRGS